MKLFYHLIYSHSWIKKGDYLKKKKKTLYFEARSFFYCPGYSRNYLFHVNLFRQYFYDVCFNSSHLVTVPPGPMLSDALLSSPVIVGEDGTGASMTGAGFEFGVDPNEDPELALVSL